MSAVRDEFEESLVAHDTALHVTGPEGFADALADAVVEPAVGARLPFEDLSLADTGVRLDPTPEDLLAAETGVTVGRPAVAAYGTVVVPTSERGEEPVSLYPPRHVAVVRESDLVADMEDGFERLASAFEAGTTTNVLTTGPSATGDMGALVQGVHGPGEVHVVLVADR